MNGWVTSPALLGQLGTPSCLTHPLSSSEQDLLWDWFPFADLTPSRGPILHPTHAQLLTLASTLRPCSSFWVSCSLWLLRILDPTQGLGLGFPTSRSCPFSLPTSNLLSRRPASAGAWGLRLAGQCLTQVGRFGGLSHMSLASPCPCPSHRPCLTRFSCLQGTLP